MGYNKIQQRMEVRHGRFETTGKIQNWTRQIAGLPIGYISKKTINGKVRYYHQWTRTERSSQYLRDEEMEALQEQIDWRKSLQAQLKANCNPARQKRASPGWIFETSVIVGKG